jgi:hypothetical protein
MNFEEALKIINGALKANKQMPLSDAERFVIERSWQNQTYEQMAPDYTAPYTCSYLSQDVGFRLWRRLSKALKALGEVESVSKTNFKAALERQWLLAEEGKNPQPPPTGEDDKQDKTEYPFYVKRSTIESQCMQAISRPGCPLRIKAPYLMGKTSLMDKILCKAQKEGYLTISLNFRLTDRRFITDLDKFLKCFCYKICRELNALGLQIQLSNNLDDYWDASFDSKYSCKDYFERNILGKIPKKLVLGLDDLDWINENDSVIANEFLDLIRSWSEAANHRRDIWKNLRVVLAYSQKISISNIYISPFNNGHEIELPEFEKAEVENLAQQYKLNWNTTHVEQLMAMVGGHPYLVQKACDSIASGYMTMEEFGETAATDKGIYREHLQLYLEHLQKYPARQQAIREVVNADKPVLLESEQAIRLESTGLVKRVGNRVIPRCQLYRQYFQQHL